MRRAIQSLKIGKTPSPGGFTGLFCKSFSYLLVPHLTQLYNSFEHTRSVTPSMTQTNFTLIVKAGKDPKICASYRPIVHLNIDVKIYSKILANRLERIVPLLIHPDQSGFIIHRQTHYNLGRLAT